MPSTIMFNPDQHHRRSIRLKNYDYSQPGAYFITICAQDRQCVFGEIAVGIMRANAVGNLAATCWQQIPQHFPNTQLDAFVIMPNHIHGILFLLDNNAGVQRMGVQCRGVQLNAPTLNAHKPNTMTPRNPNNMYSQISPQRGTLGVIIRTYKAAVTTECRKAQLAYMVWQRNYYEHVVRDERELQILREYLQNNPKQWEIDQLHPNNPSKW